MNQACRSAACRPHVALVVGHPGRVGGMERFARFLAEHILSANGRMTIALSGEDIYTGLVPRAQSQLTVDHVNWIDETLKGDRPYHWRTILSRYRWFRQTRPDVALFVQSSNTPFRASVVGAKLAGIPIVTTHRTMAWPVPPAVSRRYVFGLIRGIGLHRRKLVRKTWLTAALASRIVYNSEAVRQEYEILYRYPRHKGHVIVNPMDERLGTLEGDNVVTSAKRQGTDAITIGFVGRLGIEKRIDILLQAVAHLRTKRRVRVIVYGEGPEKESLCTLANDLGIGDRVEWCGTTDDVASAYRRFDIVALCSRRESSSNMVLEAMSAGKAVVVTKVGGLPELVGHGQYGVCVPPFDVERLATTLDRLIHDDAERARLGAQARQAARTRHDSHRVGQAWLQLLSNVARHRKYEESNDVTLVTDAKTESPVSSRIGLGLS